MSGDDCDYADLRMAMEDCDRLSIGDGGDESSSTMAAADVVKGIIDKEAKGEELVVTGQSLVESNEKEAPNNDEEDEEEESSMGLSEDIYSVMMTCRAVSLPFVFSLFVCIFQMSLIVLIALDLIDFGTDNPFKIPPAVDIEVRIAQALAVVLAVATQGDLLTAIIQLHDGYDKRVKETNASFTFGTWLFASIAQFLIGAGMLTLIFILIIQSKDVIGMMLNFAALSFVSDIDDIAFFLAKNGFVSDAVERECRQVSEYEFPTRKRKSKWFRRVLFMLITASLYGGWGYVVYEQNDGAFIPYTVFVQFGDAFDPFLASFSGQYVRSEDLYARRDVYFERTSQGAYFAYCENEQTWTFTIWYADNFDPCQAYNASSPETKVYDISNAGSPWTVAYSDRDSNIFKQPFDMFTMFADDCTDCNGLGTCVNNQCQCNGDRFGRHCEFSAPCPSLTVDQRTFSLPDDEASVSQLSDNYTLLRRNETGKLVLVYHKPVYVYDYGQGLTDIIMFLGRRWIATSTSTFFDVLNFERIYFSDIDDIAYYLSEEFHGYFSGYRAYFVSAPMDVGKDDFLYVLCLLAVNTEILTRNFCRNAQ